MDLIFSKFYFFLILGVIVHFVMMFIKWNKAKSLRKEISPKAIKTFKDYRFKAISISSGGFVGRYTFSLFTSEIDLLFTKNEIHFLPNKFSVFLYSSLLPFDVNRRLDDMEIYAESEKVKFFFSSRTFEHGESQNSVAISADRMKIGELVSFINEWQNN